MSGSYGKPDCFNLTHCFFRAQALLHLMHGSLFSSLTYTNDLGIVVHSHNIFQKIVRLHNNTYSLGTHQHMRQHAQHMHISCVSPPGLRCGKNPSRWQRFPPSLRFANYLAHNCANLFFAS